MAFLRGNSKASEIKIGKLVKLEHDVEYFSRGNQPFYGRVEGKITKIENKMATILTMFGHEKQVAISNL